MERSLLRTDPVQQAENEPEPVKHRSPEPMERQKSMQSLYSLSPGHQSPKSPKALSLAIDSATESSTIDIENSQQLDVPDCTMKPSPMQRRTPPPPVPIKSKDTRVTSIVSSPATSTDPKPHVEADCTVNNKRRSGKY